jgi:hypothetical protein
MTNILEINNKLSDIIYYVETRNLVGVKSYIADMGTELVLSKSIKDHLFVMAVNSGNLEIVKYFVSLGSDFKCKENQSLKASITNGYHHIFKYLIEIGCDIESEKDQLLFLAYTHIDPMIFEHLLKLYVNPQYRDFGAFPNQMTRTNDNTVLNQIQQHKLMGSNYGRHNLSIYHLKSYLKMYICFISILPKRDCLKLLQFSYKEILSALSYVKLSSIQTSGIITRNLHKKHNLFKSNLKPKSLCMQMILFD